MKHLRLYEEDEYFDFNISDYVILIEESDDSKRYNYKLGDLCYIINIDRYESEDMPYRIKDIRDEKLGLWVNSSQIRIPEAWELSQNKFNL